MEYSVARAHCGAATRMAAGVRLIMVGGGRRGGAGNEHWLAGIYRHLVVHLSFSALLVVPVFGESAIDTEYLARDVGGAA